MNRFAVAAALRALGLSLKYDSTFGEYRVAFRNGSEASAYYTSDLEDARDTGLAMARQRDAAAIDHAARFGSPLPASDWAAL